MQRLTHNNRLPLRPVLLQVLRQIEIVDELVHAPQAVQQFRCHVYGYVHSVGDQVEL